VNVLVVLHVLKRSLAKLFFSEYKKPVNGNVHGLFLFLSSIECKPFSAVIIV